MIEVLNTAQLCDRVRDLQQRAAAWGYKLVPIRESLPEPYPADDVRRLVGAIVQVDPKHGITGVISPPPVIDISREEKLMEVLTTFPIREISPSDVLNFKVLRELIDWFKVKIQRVEFPKTTMSLEDYKLGIDALPDIFQPMHKAAFTIWLWEKEYEVSYSQMCDAYFTTLIDAGLLTVTLAPNPGQQGFSRHLPCLHRIGIVTCGFGPDEPVHEGSREPAPPMGRHHYTPSRMTIHDNNKEAK